jgi:hypothetical protein
MSWKVTIRPLAMEQIARWRLSDFLLVEINLRLREQLPENPSSLLVRSHVPFDGMVYPFDIVDPENRFCMHKFYFHIIYGQDEQTLLVVKAGHTSRTGL